MAASEIMNRILRETSRRLRVGRALERGVHAAFVGGLLAIPVVFAYRLAAGNFPNALALSAVCVLLPFLGAVMIEPFFRMPTSNAAGFLDRSLGFPDEVLTASEISTDQGLGQLLLNRVEEKLGRVELNRLRFLHLPGKFVPFLFTAGFLGILLLLPLVDAKEIEKRENLRAALEHAQEISKQSANEKDPLIEAARMALNKAAENASENKLRPENLSDLDAKRRQLQNLAESKDKILSVLSGEKQTEQLAQLIKEGKFEIASEEIRKKLKNLGDKDLQERLPQSMELWQALSKAANSASDPAMRASLENAGKNALKDPKNAERDFLAALEQLKNLGEKEARLRSISQELAQLEHDLKPFAKPATPTTGTPKNVSPGKSAEEKVAAVTAVPVRRFETPYLYRDLVARYFTAEPSPADEK